jgi:hypothetical protein
MPSSHPVPPSCHCFSYLAAALDVRSAGRLAWLFVGAVLARGRRTVTTWIRAAGLSREYRSCYTAVSAAGRRADAIAARLVYQVVKPLVAGADRLTFALDDTPPPRYGPHVQGAGVHHNPCPGPAGSPYVYGHVWVVLGLLTAHPGWGVLALPLLARLYVRRTNLGGIDPRHRPPFRTKLELATDRMRWAVARVLRVSRRHGLRPRYLLLDRGFCSVDVVRSLQHGRHPFLMPLPLRGRPLAHPDGPSGSRVFAAARRSGWGEYTLANAAGRRATVRVCVKCRNWQGERGRHGRQRRVYAFRGIGPASVEWVRQAYRARFGIESSYRQMAQAKVVTTTRNPVVRLFRVGVALVVRNVWVWLHWDVRSAPRRGGRVVRLDRLRFKALLLWLLHVIEEQYGRWDLTYTERRLPRSVTP